MVVKRLTKFAALGLMTWTTSAWASSDMSCEADWSFRNSQWVGCNDSAMLSPVNDTRTNLLLLLQDVREGEQSPQQPLPDPFFDWISFRANGSPQISSETSQYSEGEGSRCRSNDKGAKDFLSALGSSKVLDDDRRILAEARSALRPECVSDVNNAGLLSPLLDQIRSKEGREWASYLLGAAAFYDGNFNEAQAKFSALNRSSSNWLREAALYMTGRVELNRAQVDAWDEYGNRKQGSNIDPAILSRADRALRNYLKSYPSGQYANSARGLIRRVYWLAGDNQKLATEYATLFAKPLAGLQDGTLVDEIDNKLLQNMKPTDISNPMLLAVYDLQHMRATNGDDIGNNRAIPISASVIESQRAAFAGNRDLFDYVRAAQAYYVNNDPQFVLQTLSDRSSAKTFSSIEFSRQMLRGLALMSVNDPGLKEFWNRMLEGVRTPYQRSILQFAIALTNERAGNVAEVFTVNSPVKVASVRERLLAFSAGPELLRQQAVNQTVPKHERDVALYTLLYKSLTRGRYKDFVADVNLIPAGSSTAQSWWSIFETDTVPVGIFTATNKLGEYGCPSIKQTAAILATNANDNKGRLCLSEFVRVNGLDGIVLDQSVPAYSLGGSKSQFPGSAFSRQTIYKSIVADTSASADDRSFALYRAIRCYAPSGLNDCGGEAVPKSERQSWFRQLKTSYPKSRWANELRYYW